MVREQQLRRRRCALRADVHAHEAVGLVLVVHVQAANVHVLRARRQQRRAGASGRAGRRRSGCHGCCSCGCGAPRAAQRPMCTGSGAPLILSLLVDSCKQHRPLTAGNVR